MIVGVLTATKSEQFVHGLDEEEITPVANNFFIVAGIYGALLALSIWQLFLHNKKSRNGDCYLVFCFVFVAFIVAYFFSIANF